MQSRVITKNIEVDGRTFVVKKFTALNGLAVAKMLLAKVIPLFQDFIPVIQEMFNSKKDDETESDSEAEDAAIQKKVAEVLENISLDTIANVLDKLKKEDFDYLVKMSLQSITEILPAGENPVMYSNGTYGVEGIEYDPIMVLRLTCEALYWSCGDFFAVSRWGIVMKPLFGGKSQDQ